MPKKSAGLLIYRHSASSVEVLLVHMGGPFWSKKDEGAWSIPKGELEGDEDPLSTALREVKEEMGFDITGNPVPLEPVRQPGGKIVYAWALEEDFDLTQIKSNTFKMEWPPKSGRQMEFPEVDRAEWFTVDAARRKILKGQVGFIDQLRDKLGD